MEDVLAAAGQVFEALGYASGTTNRIAERAGVGPLGFRQEVCRQSFVDVHDERTAFVVLHTEEPRFVLAPEERMGPDTRAEGANQSTNLAKGKHAMPSSHVGCWLVDKAIYSGSSSAWKPRAAFVFFGEDGRYRCGDLEGSEESGTWRYRASDDRLLRELSDADTGYRGSVDLAYKRASPEAFRENAKKCLAQLTGLGDQTAERLLAVGIRFVGEIAEWTSEDIERIAAQTGLGCEDLVGFRKSARGF